MQIPYELSDPLFFIRADIEGWRSQAEELTFIEGPLDVWTDEVIHYLTVAGCKNLSFLNCL